MAVGQRIVVMGGSFNPPTVAHSKLLIAALDTLGADLGIFVPSSDAYVRRKLRKQGWADWALPEDQRLRMLQELCALDSRLTVSDCEFQDDGTGHTYDTLEKLQAEYPDARLFFLLGGDKLSILPRWHNSQAFLERFHFAVVKRDGTDPERLIQAIPALATHRDSFHCVPEPEGVAEISSTAVRERLRSGDPSAAELLTPGVYDMLVSAGWTAKDITSFRGDYDFLSNFYEAPVTYGGLRYLNSEAAFQAQKCLTEEEKQAFTALTAPKAKRLGRQVALRPDWEDVKYGFMEEIVRAKFQQHPELAARLAATRGRRLIEGNTWHDTCWGVDAATGKGENRLGRILMEVRAEILQSYGERP